MKVTQEQLTKMFGLNAANAQAWADAFNPVLEKYNINTPLRISHFMAQVGHESGGLTIFEENLNYSADGLLRVFPKYFNGPQATQYARRPEKIANRVYANRMGNGSEESGDGWKYRGRGPIQITGKDNYKNLTSATGVDFVTNPDDLKIPANGALASGWFWNSKSLNTIADANDILSITKRVNGGTNGLDDRTARFNKAKTIFV
ncbi:putative chitinase [Ralstonia phage RSP15]|uniref:endolysin n=1 Tax=Ralstonia phage RSP15 TaxID=1785960 RepID=UPI00074D41EC|nr:endolysin [Ralstonia phage RSP15]BAU40039.1 putative chitinase [Ralstonia phage RSP15]